MKKEASEQKFLADYRPEDFRRPSVAVDVVVLTVHEAKLSVLLAMRNEHPFKGKWALPGGFLRVGPSPKDQGEDLDAAAVRELEEETGLSARRDDVFFEQLHAFGKAGRDPRMRVVSVAYYALVRPDLLPLVRAGGDVSRVGWTPVSDALTSDLAFDHTAILGAAALRVTEQLETTAIAKNLVGSTFTIPELRTTFEIVSGKTLDHGNFRRKLNALVESGVVERAPGKRATASKPAAIYRFRQPLE